jgi:hypothetical protein
MKRKCSQSASAARAPHVGHRPHFHSQSLPLLFHWPVVAAVPATLTLLLNPCATQPREMPWAAAEVTAAAAAAVVVAVAAVAEAAAVAGAGGDIMAVAL